MAHRLDYRVMLEEALVEARLGLAEGGLPVGAALFDEAGRLIGRGRNRRVQDQDPSMHAAVNAFRNAGRRKDYAGTVLALTQAPCWFCSGLVRQFGIATVVVGDVAHGRGGLSWLKRHGVKIVEVKSPACEELLDRFILAQPGLWEEDQGLAPDSVRVAVSGPTDVQPKKRAKQNIFL